MERAPRAFPLPPAGQLEAGALQKLLRSPQADAVHAVLSEAGAYQSIAGTVLAKLAEE